MGSPTYNRINQNKYLQMPLDCPSVWFGDLSDTPWAFVFYNNRRDRQNEKRIHNRSRVGQKVRNSLK